MKKRTLLFTIFFSICGLVFSANGAAAEGPISSPTPEVTAQDSITVMYQPVKTNKLTARGAGVMVDIAPCKLVVQNVYLRQSFGYNGVGTKATTTCSFPVTSISHTTYVEKLGFFGWSTQGVFPASNQVSSTLYQTDVGVNCANGLPTTWSAYTSGKVIYKGVEYFANVRAANVSAEFDCGT